LSSHEDQVRELAKLAVLSGRISEFHERNLNAYPFIFFNGVSEAAISYDLEKGGKNQITFKLTLKASADNLDLDKRINALERSIKNLFWKDIEVSVYMDGKRVGVKNG
jgi:hypothetical protein